MSETSVNKKKHGSIMSTLMDISASLQAPSIKIRTNFFRLMSISQEVGLGLRDSLINIKKTERNATMREVQGSLIDSLSEGKSLANSMEAHPHVFASNEIELVRAAENMGTLPRTLREIATEMENMQQIYQKIRAAITYPVILLLFSVIAVIILLVYVIPTIVSLFPSTDSLPGITIMMLTISNFLSQTWYLLILLIL